MKEITIGSQHKIEDFNEVWEVIGMDDEFICFKIIEGDLKGGIIKHFNLEEFKQLIK